MVTPSAPLAIVVDRKVPLGLPVRRARAARQVLWVQPVRPDRLARKVSLAVLRDRPDLLARQAQLAPRVQLAPPDRKVQPDPRV